MLATALLIFVSILWDFFVYGLFQYKHGYIIGFRYLCQCFDFESTFAYYAYLFLLTITIVFDISVSYYLKNFIILDILMYIFFIWVVITCYQNYDSLYVPVDLQEILNEKIRYTAHLIFIGLLSVSAGIELWYMLKLNYEGFDITFAKWFTFIFGSLMILFSIVFEILYHSTRLVISPIFVKLLVLLWITVLPYLTILQLIIKSRM